MSDRVTVRIRGPMYFSQHDEDVFFEWLNLLPSVTRVRGELDELFIEVDSARFDMSDLREILALFRRYGIELTALAALEREDNRVWFRDVSEWWHPLIFPREPEL